jgi:AcrR family transcriptional regulator
MPIRSSASRRERARAQARQDILLAAAGVFSRRGYAAATLSEIAEEAGFAAPSLYRYFASKEELFRSIVELVKREMDATFDAAVDRGSPLAERLVTLLEAQYRVAQTHRPALEMLRNPGPDAPEDVRGAGSPRVGMAFYTERLAAWLARNAAPAELRHAPELTARAFTGILFSFHPECEPAESNADRSRLVVSLAFEGLAAPAARRRGATPWTAAPAPSPSQSPRRSPPRAGSTPRRRRSRTPAPPSAPSA